MPFDLTGYRVACSIPPLSAPILFTWEGPMTATLELERDLRPFGSLAPSGMIGPTVSRVAGDHGARSSRNRRTEPQYGGHEKGKGCSHTGHLARSRGK